MNSPSVLSPITGAKTAALVKSYAVAPLIEKWSKQLSIDVRDEFKGVSEFYLYECLETGLYFFRPDSLTGSANLYEKLAKHSWYYAPKRWEHARALRDIRECYSVLEVGCGRGEFVKDTIARGHAAIGLETNPVAVNNMNAGGIPYIEGGIEALPASKNSTIDCICAFQLLEHLSDPLSFFHEVLRLLRKGGLLVVSVPNRLSFLQYIENILDLPPHHMSQWTERSFRSLEKYLPVKVRYCRFERLSAAHVPGFLDATNHRLALSCGPCTAEVLSVLVRLLLKMGFRRVCTGQSIYVILQKQ
jgi:SAM-dependent methyltransferase